jgi:hypothetical protein
MLDVRASARDGPVAQRLEQGTHNPLVPGSNPGGPSPESFQAEAKRASPPNLSPQMAGFFSVAIRPRVSEGLPPPLREKSL